MTTSDYQANVSFDSKANLITMVVTLDENPSTGYKWALGDPEVLPAGCAWSTTYTPSEARDLGFIGGGGKRTFTFVYDPHNAVPGVPLLFIYHRPFDPQVDDPKAVVPLPGLFGGRS